MTKSYGFAEAKPYTALTNIENQLYKLIKTKQYDIYWDLLRKHSHIKNLSPQFKNIFLKIIHLELYLII